MGQTESSSGSSTEYFLKMLDEAKERGVATGHKYLNEGNIKAAKAHFDIALEAKNLEEIESKKSKKEKKGKKTEGKKEGKKEGKHTKPKERTRGGR
jgi:hypothetical protein